MTGGKANSILISDQLSIEGLAVFQHSIGDRIWKRHFWTPDVVYYSTESSVSCLISCWIPQLEHDLESKHLPIPCESPMRSKALMILYHDKHNWKWWAQGIRMLLPVSREMTRSWSWSCQRIDRAWLQRFYWRLHYIWSPTSHICPIISPWESAAPKIENWRTSWSWIMPDQTSSESFRALDPKIQLLAE
jgi:hypothetical protein